SHFLFCPMRTTRWPEHLVLIRRMACYMERSSLRATGAFDLPLNPMNLSEKSPHYCLPEKLLGAQVDIVYDSNRVVTTPWPIFGSIHVLGVVPTLPSAGPRKTHNA